MNVKSVHWDNSIMLFALNLQCYWSILPVLVDSTVFSKCDQVRKTLWKQFFTNKNFPEFPGSVENFWGNIFRINKILKSWDLS